MPPTWLFTVAYDGSSYCGWQIQPNKITIQGLLEYRLSQLFSTELSIAAPSRTDAGVHALGQRFSLPRPERPPIPSRNVLTVLQRSLPADIRVITVEEMPEGFHARHDAIAKVYTYILHDGSLRSPFLPRYCWAVPEHFDIEPMIAAAKCLLGEHDFTLFSVASAQHDGCRQKRLDEIRIRHEFGFTLISVRGGSFLYRMVRRIVGFLVAVGQGRIEPTATARYLAGEARLTQFDTAPPHGLYLEKVFYTPSGIIDYVPVKLPFMALVGHRETTVTSINPDAS